MKPSSNDIFPHVITVFIIKLQTNVNQHAKCTSTTQNQSSFTLPTLFRYPFNTYITVFSLATDTVVTKGIYKKVLPKS